MNAYVKAARIYDDAASKGRFNGCGSKEIVDLIIKTTGLTDRKLFDTMVPNGISPDGAVNMKSLDEDLKFFVAQGQIEKLVTVICRSCIARSSNSVPTRLARTNRDVCR